MGSQPAQYPKTSFGPFEFVAVSGDLRKFGTRIRLQGKPLQILTLLLERPGQIVSREELQKHLWQGTTFVDFEQGLNSAVNKLRQALGDSPDQPRYIETLPGKGYRFIAPLQNQSNRTVLEIAPPVAPAVKPAKSWIPWTLALSLAAAVGFLAGNRQSSLRLPVPTTRFSVIPPPGFALEGAASRQSFALSPDGTRLAFSAIDSSGTYQLFLRDLNNPQSHPIPNTRGAHTLFWHSSSDAIYISIQGKIRRVPLNGEGFVAICDAPAFTLNGLLVSPTNLLLDTNAITYSVSPSGGTPDRVKNFLHWPQTLPGTDDILYTAWDPAAKRHRAVIGGPDKSESAKLPLLADSRILFAPSTITPGASFLLYVSGGNLVAHPFDLARRQLTGDAIPVVNQVYSFLPLATADFSVSANGILAYQKYAARSQLAWVDRAGRRLATAGPANVNLKSARLSPDGRHLATSIYELETSLQNLWIIDTVTAAAKQLTSAFGLSDAPVWGPHGGKLAFLHGSGGRTPKIGIRGLAENATEAIESEGGFQLPTDWSPDGRFIAFSNNGIARLANEIQGDVFLMDLSRNRRTIPLLHSTFHEGNATFSPDGKWLAFTSNESGRTELYLQAFTGGDNPAVTGERFPVSRAGAQVVRWRRDGKEIFYLGFDGKVYAVSVQLGQRPAFGPAAPLFEISTEARAAIHALVGFDVSPDGQRFVIPTVSDAEAPSIVVVQNWETSLPVRR